MLVLGCGLSSRLKRVAGDACGSVIDCSIDCLRICFSSASSASGKVGSRSTSRISFSKSPCCWRLLSQLTLNDPAPVLTDSVDLRLSSLLLDLLPRVILGARASSSGRHSRRRSSCRSAILRCRNAASSRPTTVSPRVFFGKKATFRPLESVKRLTRFSMFSGVASKASPSTTAFASLEILDQLVDVRRFGHRGAHDFLRWNEHADGAIAFASDICQRRG